MFPFIFEWAWDVGHFIFMGLLYMVLIVIGTGVHVVVGKTLFDFVSGIDVKHH